MQGTALESALRRERWLIGSGLSLVVILCWAWIVPMGRDMYGSMTGPSAWMMTTRWDAVHLLSLFAMWAAMMIGMMLPSAAPALLLYANVLRKSDAEGLTARVYAFAGGYVVVWVAFSALATLMQRLLSRWLVLSPMMETRSPVWSGALLLVAGAYQLTPMKRTCLDSCRSPAAFISAHWRRGSSGAFRMGWEHGIFCLGCCWALMMLLFAGGVMNLYVIAALTGFVLVEKLVPGGAQGGRLSGVLLLALGIWFVMRSAVTG